MRNAGQQITFLSPLTSICVLVCHKATQSEAWAVVSKWERKYRLYIYLGRCSA